MTVALRYRLITGGVALHKSPYLCLLIRVSERGREQVTVAEDTEDKLGTKLQSKTETGIASLVRRPVRYVKTSYTCINMYIILYTCTCVHVSTRRGMNQLPAS